MLDNFWGETIPHLFTPVSPTQARTGLEWATRRLSGAPVKIFPQRLKPLFWSKGITDGLKPVPFKSPISEAIELYPDRETMNEACSGLHRGAHQDFAYEGLRGLRYQHSHYVRYVVGLDFFVVGAAAYVESGVD